MKRFNVKLEESVFVEAWDTWLLRSPPLSAETLVLK